MQTIQKTIQGLHGALRDYIEATYHISAPPLITQRKELLNCEGVIHRVPYLESTPRYKAGASFATMEELPPAARELFSRLSTENGELQRLIYDPPYQHQADSVRHNLIEGKNLVVMTGTGSGKTECFLLPILGKFAAEAKTRPTVFEEQTAMRALILYPMNALVNDQLGRLRTLFGDPRLVEMFRTWAGRPPRFARYTGVTPYAGVRTREDDSTNLKFFYSFYVDILRRTESTDEEERCPALKLLSALKERGKWPAKPDLGAWLGEKGSEWQDRVTGEFVRAITLSDDSELLTRHEIQKEPPDLLVTNYSMLEYMLIRPIERSIFDRTRKWLDENPNESFLVVLDEAHLYRGSFGAEVGLLMRRLRDRLGVSEDRFRVICATASFKDVTYAPDFGAQISGIPADSFVPIKGTLDLRKQSELGTMKDAKVLSTINLSAFYDANDDECRIALVKPLLAHRGVAHPKASESALFEALTSYGPMGALINATMAEARPITELSKVIFEGDVPPTIADQATTALMALGSVARSDPKLPGLLPCRIHNFFRGLPGLWVCMDPNCSELSASQRNDVCGKMYPQPKDQCSCGGRVLELFTCRDCGTAYARAYTDDLNAPYALWAEPGEQLRMAGGESISLSALDLLLEKPADAASSERVNYDLRTGQLSQTAVGRHSRKVHIRRDRTTEATGRKRHSHMSVESSGQFKKCAVCDKIAGYGRSPVQNHQTKGNQPFQALLARQIQIQPPGSQRATRFAPLRGRKVLAFSDSRQVAARLAPQLQTYSERDSLRPLIVSGFKWLMKQDAIRQHLNLDDLYFGVLLASRRLNVRLLPGMGDYEDFEAEDILGRAIRDGDLDNPIALMELLMDMRSLQPPESLLRNMLSTLTDRYLGMESLALATIRECDSISEKIVELPHIQGLADTDYTKLGLARYWLRCWSKNGFKLAKMPVEWIDRASLQGFHVKSRNPKFEFDAIDFAISDTDARKVFWQVWSPKLLEWFTKPKGTGRQFLNGSKLSLLFEENWTHCLSCKSVHRPIPEYLSCLDCGSVNVRSLDPDNDTVFNARRGYYRKPVIEALSDTSKHPMALIAAEHTAQLNAPHGEAVFSKAEENELLFQDIELQSSALGNKSTAIDILSCTTTMEVGIDLGALSGVALRNMPPSRANYQQRAGRAGRRGNAVATVVAFGSADSHDEHYFSAPDEMIRGDVVDPKLTLDNIEIVRRHIRAFLLQNYHQDRLPFVDLSQPHDLFSVLGSVADFLAPDSRLNLADFEAWLVGNENILRERIATWIPTELSKADRQKLCDSFIEDCVDAVKEAVSPNPRKVEDIDDNDVRGGDETATGQWNAIPHQASGPDGLLRRLLDFGKLPRYAFPTDVIEFQVFNRERSSPFRHIRKFAPSRNLPIALSEYAPDKQVWIAGNCYTSGAIYSVKKSDRISAWKSRKIYMECSECGFAETFSTSEVDRKDIRNCNVCGSKQAFGPARYWMRPPGFAHPVSEKAATSIDQIPEISYATRAKLTMGTPRGGWAKGNDRIRGLKSRQRLLVSNAGPRNKGYTYCVKCGRIEASSTSTPSLFVPHPKPYPESEDKRMCEGFNPSRQIVLGTDFITDIALFSMRVAEPMALKPGHFSTSVALRTVSEALAQSVCQMLIVEPGELKAEYRPALTKDGKKGHEAEIFFYDTLPGGAGFSGQFADRSLELFTHALHLLNDCPANCDSSCYRCLRSFKNKLDHRLLDRHIGVQLLDYLVTGNNPEFNKQRLSNSTNLLFNDLLRRDEGSITFKRDVKISYGTGRTAIAPIFTEHRGKKFVIALSAPLTTDCPADPHIAELHESGAPYQFIIQNELVVRNSLPHAARRVYCQVSE